MRNDEMKYRKCGLNGGKKNEDTTEARVMMGVTKNELDEITNRERAN